MKKIIYYVVELELQDAGLDVRETTGHKTITAYSISNNKLETFFTLETCNELNSIEEINEYLEDNGYGDEEFELIQL